MAEEGPGKEGIPPDQQLEAEVQAQIQVQGMDKQGIQPAQIGDLILAGEQLEAEQEAQHAPISQGKQLQDVAAEGPGKEGIPPDQQLDAKGQAKIQAQGMGQTGTQPEQTQGRSGADKEHGAETVLQLCPLAAAWLDRFLGTNAVQDLEAAQAFFAAEAGARRRPPRTRERGAEGGGPRRIGGSCAAATAVSSRRGGAAAFQTGRPSLTPSPPPPPHLHWRFFFGGGGD